MHLECEMRRRSPFRIALSAGYWGAVFIMTAGWGTLLRAAPIEKASFPVSGDIESADIYYFPAQEPVKAVLVLCPGDNGNGRKLLEMAEWSDYANSNHVGLVGLSFVSKLQDLNADRGYYRVEKQSGRMVLDAVDKVFGPHKPLLMYGFSGGAHFTSNFVTWSPHRVLAWCAYSAAWWDTPAKAGVPSPPGIIACGQLDTTRKDESYKYFKTCRVNGQRVTWICLPETGHELSLPLENLVRSYFHEILVNTNNLSGLWYDVDKRQPVEVETAASWPTLYSWLPSENVAREWQSLHLSN